MCKYMYSEAPKPLNSAVHRIEILYQRPLIMGNSQLSYTTTVDSVSMYV